MNKRRSKAYLVPTQIFGDASEGHIFPDGSRLQLHSGSGVPEGIVIHQMYADRGVRSAMIGLRHSVSLKSLCGNENAAYRTLAKYGGCPSPTLIRDRLRLAGENSLDIGIWHHSHDSRLQWQPCWESNRDR